MLFACGQDKKTLTDVMRDYRAGLLQKVEIPGWGTANENCLLVNAYSSNDTLSPGDIIPLKDFQFFGDDQRLDDDIYAERMLFGCSDRCGSFKNLSGFTEDPYKFTPIPFGIAKDFVSYEIPGNVQVEGRCWVLIENLDSDYQITYQNRFVVLRKNSRHDGKPFLQTAPDGLAEVLYLGKTTESGLQWALIQLNHTYGETLCKVHEATSDISKGTFIYSVGPSYSLTDFNPYLYQTATSAHHHPFYLRNDYKLTYDNYVAIEKPETFSFNPSGKDFFHLYDVAPTGLSPYDNVTTTNPGLPTHVLVNTSLSPFPGGVFTASYYNQSGETFFSIFGNKIPVSNATSAIPHLDIWHGDKVQVLLQPNDGEKIRFSPTSFHLHIVNGPTDLPVDSYIMALEGSYGDLLSRGWQVQDWRSTFTADVAVLLGNGSLANHYHTHNFTYSTDTTPSIQSITDQPDTAPITFDTPFRISILKKVTAGFTVQ